VPRSGAPASLPARCLHPIWPVCSGTVTVRSWTPGCCGQPSVRAEASGEVVYRRGRRLPPWLNTGCRRMPRNPAVKLRSKDLEATPQHFVKWPLSCSYCAGTAGFEPATP
jgi:hypothetical protein